MSTVLSVYGQQAFKEYLLPAVNNAETSIVLSKDVYQLMQDVEIRLEVVEHRWSILPADDYQLRVSDAPYQGEVIKGGDLIRLEMNGANVVTIMVRTTDVYFSVFGKYKLPPGGQQVTVGHDDACEITYHNNLLSAQHCVIVRDASGGFLVTDTSKNGVFVNNKKVRQSARLSFGDRIDIFGLCIVILNDEIAVNTEEGDIRIKGEVLSESAPAVDERLAPPNSTQKTLYHRSPRFLPRIDTEKVEIDAAPNPRELPQQSVLMTIGPSMTMALPMILGSVMSMIAANRSGGTASAFMYTGMVIALCSAALGTFWGFTNMRNARKRAKEDEEKRLFLYGEYLQKKENEIRAKDAHNTEVLYQRYASAEDCASYNAQHTELWNRNRRQEDFLTHRVGIGSIPSPNEVIVPKEKFTMIPDELMEKPRLLKEQHKLLKNVPVCVDLLEHRLIGVAGGKAKTGALLVMKNLIVQIAANNSYTDVKLAIIYDAKDTESRQAWSFARWLPHVWNENKTFRYVAETAEDASDVFYELAKIFRQRAEESKNESTDVPKPYYVILIANAELLEGELLSGYLLNPVPSLGVTTVLMTETYRHLPNEVEYIIENDAEYSGLFHVADTLEERIPAVFDTLSGEHLEDFARTLANIEITEMESGGDIPGALTFFDMYGVQKLPELAVVERWRKNRTYESMRAIVGFKAGGAPCYLDIHEKYHGPHGLVAGTTGSGKSETLQTYILSLAINFSPHDVGFFVIDYKGGGMANLFSDLPHLIGQISNLSGNQVRRAMVSIKSENLRRQRIFNEYGVNNINSYTRLVKAGEAKIPVPHMFIIIDEFAELKREEPDFMRELISVAQVGRSLGVHLILATQKPSGTVDDNIWSNSKFRLCLRVQDKQDSNDMLHRPDAAYITQAGRCYLQVGNDELFELFQSGWSGATYSEDDEDAKQDVARMLSVTGNAALEGNRTKFRKKEEARKRWIGTLLQNAQAAFNETNVPVDTVLDGAEEAKLFFDRFFALLSEKKIDYPLSDFNKNRITDLLACAKDSDAFTKPASEAASAVIAASERLKKKLPEEKEKTQLDAVVEYLKSTAAANGYDYNFQLWLPVLPEKLLMESLHVPERFDGTTWEAHGAEFTLETPIGLYDDPENQNQSAFFVNVAEGNLAVCGSVATGKSVFLQSLVYGLMRRYSPQELNFYLIDFSAKMLAPFAAAPHTGGVVFEDDADKIDKFFVMLQGMIERRKSLLKGGNYAQFVRAKGGAEEPAVLVVFDNYGNFRAKTANRYDDLVVQISKEANAYGIYLAFSSAGFQSAEIPSKLSDTLKTTFSLEMNDRFQYMEVTRSMHLDIFPEVGVAGRGIAKMGERILEFQTALSLDADDDFARGEAIEKACREMADVWSGKRALPIPEIPEKPVYDEFIALEEAAAQLADDRHLPVGYDWKFASPYSVDLSRFYTYLISGKAKTGVENLFKILMTDAAAKGGRLVLFDFDEEYTRLAKQTGAEIISTSADMSSFFAGVIETLKERKAYKQQLIAEDIEEEAVYERMQQYERIFLFVGRLSSFVETAYRQEEDVANASGLICNILDKGEGLNIYWIGAYFAEDASRLTGMEAFTLFARRKTGIHFGGNVASQNLFTFDYLNYSDQNKPLKPNIALLPSGEEELVTTHVIVPQIKV